MRKNGPQSLAGFIRQHLASIELQVHYGVHLEVIRQELATAGFETTALSLRNALSRARKRAREMTAAPMGEKAAVGGFRHAPAASMADAAMNAPPVKAPAPKNPLLAPRGFVYEGTRGINKDDLI